jgi:LmeA-like phospholipid-binding
MLALVIADRVGRSVAEQKVAEQVTQQADKQDIKFGQSPTVDITGFPFLTQVIAGKYDKVLVHMRDIQAQAYSVPKLDVAATGVHAKVTDVLNGSGPITADQVDGTATIGYGYLQQVAAEQIGKQVNVQDLRLSGDNGRLTIHASVSVLGQQIKLIGQTKLTLTGNNKVRIDVLKITPDGVELPGYAKGALDQLAGQLSTELDLPDLPYHLRLSGVEAASDGLRVTAGAANVSLAQ